MMKLLVDGHEAVARIARGIFPLAEKASGEPTADLLTQALRCASITLSTARRYVPSGAGPPTGACVRVRPAASGQRDLDSECPFRVGRVSSLDSYAVIQPAMSKVPR